MSCCERRSVVEPFALDGAVVRAAPWGAFAVLVAMTANLSPKGGRGLLYVFVGGRAEPDGFAQLRQLRIGVLQIVERRLRRIVCTWQAGHWTGVKERRSPARGGIFRS